MRRLPRFALTGGALGVCLLAIACSSTSSTPSTSPGAANTGAPSNATSQPATAGASNTQLATAGPELSAFHLMTAAAYSAALGEPVTRVEDDGVVPVDSGCEWGQARVITQADVILTVGLHTARSADEVAQLYRTLGNFTGTPAPIAGAGEEAAYSAGLAVVRKGLQVLVVSGQPGRIAQSQLDAIKLNEGDPVPAYNAMVAVAEKAAAVLAAKVSGQGCPDSPALGIPAGALAPCPGDPSELASALDVPAIAAKPVISDEFASQECLYSLGTEGTFRFYSVTDAQAMAALEQTTAGDVFAAQRTAAMSSFQNANVQQFDNGTFGGWGATTPGRRGPGIVGAIDFDRGGLVEGFWKAVQDGSNLAIHPEKCLPLARFWVRAWMRGQGLNPDAPDIQEKETDAINQWAGWCIKTATRD